MVNNIVSEDIKTIETNDGHYHRCKWLVDNATPYQKNIIDIGCSDGFMFRDHPLDIVEVDMMYAFPDSYKYKIKFVKADAHYLPFKDKSFKCAIVGDMLEHVKNPVQVLKEAKRVAKDIFITVPNEWEWKLESRPFGNACHIRFYKLDTLKTDLDESLRTYEIIKIRGGSWSFFAISHKE